MKFTIPTTAQQVLTALRTAGFEAYIVGGCIRDLLLSRETRDWDFTTNAIPEQITALFPDSFYDNAFGTVGIPIRANNVILSPEGVPLGRSEESRSYSEDQRDPSPDVHRTQDDIAIYEITTYRSEHGYSDHRHPDKVIWGTKLEEDLQRRDFTINAMAYDGEKIIDLFGGQQDAEQHIIRAVGDPGTRFSEDALRMFRAIRLATQLQFLIEPATFSAIQTHANLLTQIAWERIREEFLKIISSPYAPDGIRLLRNASILQIILPELEHCFLVDQKSPKRHHQHDVGTHLLLSLQHVPSTDPITRLATLLHDIGKPPTVKVTDEGVVTFYNHEIVGASLTSQIARRLRLSNKEMDKLVRLVRYHQFTVDERQTDSALRRFIRNVTKEYLDDMLALRTGDRLGGGAKETSWRLDLYKKRLNEVQQQPFSIADLKVSGHDVMTIYEIKPGRIVGAVLEMLFTDVEEGKLPNEREILLKRIEDLKKESFLEGGKDKKEEKE